MSDSVAEISRILRDDPICAGRVTGATVDAIARLVERVRNEALEEAVSALVALELPRRRWVNRERAITAIRELKGKHNG